MLLRATDRGLQVWAPAKLNLFLEILSRRGDGFHEIETLICPIGLYDTLTFDESSTGAIDFSCAWAAEVDCSVEVPQGADNTVVRALTLLRNASATDRGANVRLLKRIPAAAGLAGGSSDAAAALVAANRVWQLNWPRERLAEIAAAVGSDVPFFLGGGSAVCRGRGERIEPLEAPRLDFVVVHPPVGLGTAEVYRACRPAGRPRTAAALVTAWQAGCLAEVGRRLHNGLQAAARSLAEAIGRLEEEFARLDLLGHAMSGSGSSYFGLCRSRRQAGRNAALLRSRGLGRAYAVSSVAGPESYRMSA